jgi:hypothetical protein
MKVNIFSVVVVVATKQQPASQTTVIYYSVTVANMATATNLRWVIC